MKKNLIKIRHVGIVSKDLEKSLNFWINQMDFKIFKEMNEEGDHIDSITNKKNSKVKTVKLIGPSNFMIEILDFENNDSPIINSKAYSYGITHIAIELEDINKKYIELKSAGIKFNSPPNTTPDNYAKMTYFEAPDGVFIELVELLK